RPGPLPAAAAVRARLGRPIAMLVGVRRQLHPESSSARLVRGRAYLSAVCLDDRPADREPHAHSLGFRSEERLEDLLSHLGRESGARLAHPPDHPPPPPPPPPDGPPPP